MQDVMKTIIKWTVVAGCVWFILYLACVLLGSFLPPDRAQIAAALGAATLDIGRGLGNFIRPVLQLGLIVFILLEAARVVGFSIGKKDVQNRVTFGFTAEKGNIQAIIAIIML